MKLKDLKTWINKLSDKELEKELIYSSTEYGISGAIPDVHKSEEDLYYVGDEPSLLHTKEQLLARGYTEDAIAAMDVEIPKDCYYIELDDEYSILERFSH